MPLLFQRLEEVVLWPRSAPAVFWKEAKLFDNKMSTFEEISTMAFALHQASVSNPVHNIYNANMQNIQLRMTPKASF